MVTLARGPGNNILRHSADSAHVEFSYCRTEITINLNIIGPQKTIGNGTIRRCGFFGIGLALLEEVSHFGMDFETLLVPKTETRGSLIFRPAWSIEKVQEQPRLSSEEIYKKQKSAEDVIERSLNLRPA